MGETHDGRLAQQWEGGSNNIFDADYDKKVPVRSFPAMWWKRKRANFSDRKTDGSAWSFGSNWSGMLADGKTTSSRNEPYQFMETSVTQIAASWSFGAPYLKMDPFICLVEIFGTTWRWNNHRSEPNH